jgi:hypothetical protein
MLLNIVDYFSWKKQRNFFPLTIFFSLCRLASYEKMDVKPSLMHDIDSPILHRNLGMLRRVSAPVACYTELFDLKEQEDFR